MARNTRLGQTNPLGPLWWNTQTNEDIKARQEAEFAAQHGGMTPADYAEAFRIKDIENTPDSLYTPPAIPEGLPQMPPLSLAAQQAWAKPATVPPPAAPGKPLAEGMGRGQSPYAPEMNSLIGDMGIKGFTGMPDTNTGLGFVGQRSTTPDITKLTAEQEALKKKYAGLQSPSKGPEISEDGSFYKSKNDWKPIPGMKMLTAGNLSMGVEAAAQAVVEGRAAISMYPGMGANSMKSQVAARVYQLNPKFDQVESENNFKASQMYSGAINSAPAVQVRQYLESVNKSLDELTKVSEALPRSQWRTYNWAKIKALAETGDVNAARFQTVATETADQVAKILQGGGTGSGTSDAKLRQGVDLLNPAWSVEQLAGVIDELKTLLQNRAEGLTTNVMQTASTQKKAKLAGNSSGGGAGTGRIDEALPKAGPGVKVPAGYKLQHNPKTGEYRWGKI